MSTLVRICLHVIASATLAANCLAQEQRTRQAKPEPPPFIVIAPGVPVSRVEVKPPETRNLGQAVVTYTPLKNHTTVGVTLQDVYRRGEVTTKLLFSFAFKGREPVKENEVYWGFISRWDIFRSGAPLTVVADGRRYSFKVERDKSVGGLHVGRMDFASFERLAHSKSARLSVGRVAFDLTEGQREALRDMLKVFEKPAEP